MHIKKILKKVFTLGIVFAMVLGTLTTVSAEEYEAYTFDGKGYAEYILDCVYETDFACANTVVEATYEADTVLAYVWLELDLVVGGSNYELVDEDIDSDGPRYGFTANAYLEFEADADYNTGVIAYSDHEAAIGDESNSCSLTMER